MKSILLLLILMARFAGAVWGQASPPPGPASGETNDWLSLDQVVSQILSNNPSLQAARANWEALQERVPQARAWDDLKLGVDVTANRSVEVPPNSFTDQSYSLEQAVPLSGKNRLRGRSANAEALAAQAEWQRRRLDLIHRARSAYFRLANAYGQLDLTQKNIDLLKQFAAISRDKYEVGRQTQADVLTAETEEARLEEARFDFLRQISDDQSQLNVLMNRPPRALLARPAAMPFIPFHLSPEELQDLALAHRPELRIAQLKIDAARAGLTLARRYWVPDPSLRLTANQYNETSHGISDVTAGIVFNVPWLNHGKYAAGIRENRKMVESAEHDLDALKSETLGMVRDQFKKVETFHHHYELFRDKILPLARQTVEARRLGYEADRAGFLDLILAQRTWRETESMALQHLTDYLTAQAELAAMVGTDLDAHSRVPHPTRSEAK